MNLTEKDLRHIWHPCTQAKDYDDLKPIIIDRGEGVFLYDKNGKQYLDIISSWWCNLLGHCNPKINEAVIKQLGKLEHVIFANFSHEPAIELCEELIKIIPEGLSRFSFSDCGSAAVESALKMSFQYQQQIGQTKRKKFMCLTEAYHGETLGSLSVGSMDLYSKIFAPLLMDTIRIEAPDCYRCPYGKVRERCSCECFEHAEKAFEEQGAEACAIIVEPIVQGSAGMRIYPALYLKKLRALCDEFGVLLIGDEIATGYGRTGKMFAFEYAGVSPDIMCISKGLTGGYLPMALTVTTETVYDAFYGDYSQGKTFMHSHTYSGNPLGCAAALAVLNILRQDRVLEIAAANAKGLTTKLKSAFLEHKNVGEIRHIGLINAIELVADKKTKTPFAAHERIGYEIYKKALKNGLILRPMGDIMYFNPPLNITEKELDQAVELCRRSILEVLE